MTLYDFNKDHYNSLPTMTPKELERSRPYIVTFLDKYKSGYYLMLNHELHYFTLFTFPKGVYNPGAMAREIISIASELGEIKSIEESENHQALEIWISSGKECYVYNLFDYTKGVIEVG